MIYLVSVSLRLFLCRLNIVKESAWQCLTLFPNYAFLYEPERSLIGSVWPCRVGSILHVSQRWQTSGKWTLAEKVELRCHFRLPQDVSPESSHLQDISLLLLLLHQASNVSPGTNVHNRFRKVFSDVVAELLCELDSSVTRLLTEEIQLQLKKYILKILPCQISPSLHSFWVRLQVITPTLHSLWDEPFGETFSTAVMRHLCLGLHPTHLP